MLGPMTALLGVACAAGLLPQLLSQAQLAAAKVFNTQAYAAVVLRGAPAGSIHPLQRLAPTDPTLFHAGTGAAAAAGALLVATAAWRNRSGPRALVAMTGLVAAAMRPLRRGHSGDLRDYIAWLVLGVGVLGGVVAVVAR
jgi:hypothetical protein